MWVGFPRTPDPYHAIQSDPLDFPAMETGASSQKLSCPLPVDEMQSVLFRIIRRKMDSDHCPPTRESCPPDANPPRFNFAVLLLAVILLAQGCIIAWAGWQAVASGHYETSWKSRSSFGASSGVDLYSGADAVRMGFGLASFGVMLFIWGAGLVAGFFNSRPDGLLQKFKLLLGGLSFVALSAGCVCVYPPWSPASLSFYAVVLITFGIWICSWAAPPAFQGLGKVVFPCLIGLSIILSNFAHDIALGILLGIFASLGLLAHLFTLFPKWYVSND